jgi:hypothetical protein
MTTALWRRSSSVALATLVVGIGAGAAFGQPANDQCSSATTIGPAVPLTVNGTTVGATSEIPASNCSATGDDTIDVWYRFQNGATTRTYTFDTNGTLDTGGNFGDTSLELFTAVCGGTSVGCDDDSGIGLASRVTYTMAANEIVFIRVAFLSNCADPPGCTFMGTVTGPFVLNITEGVPPPPANDTCANATVIAAADSSTLGDNDNSTGVDITPCSNTDEQDVWFTFTPSVSGQYRIDTLGSMGNTDTSLAIYQGCPDEMTPNVQPNWPANLLACNDDQIFTGGATDEYLSMLRANLQAGTAYKIRVSGFNNSTGGFVLNVSAPNPTLLPAAPNTCATAQNVVGTFTQTYYTGGNRPGGPAGTCNAADPIGLNVNDNALYLTFIPGANGNLSGTISGESGTIQSDSVLVMFSGACGALTELVCLDDTANGTATYDLSTLPAVTAGTSYVLLFADYGTFDSGSDVSVNITVPGAAGNGACCAGSSCSVSSQAACVGTNTAYAGNGTACNAPGNATTPCCKADFNHAGGTTVQDIFDFLAAYFSGSPLADINGGGGVTVQDIFDFLAAYFAGC